MLQQKGTAVIEGRTILIVVIVCMVIILLITLVLLMTSNDRYDQYEPTIVSELNDLNNQSASQYYTQIESVDNCTSDGGNGDLFTCDTTSVSIYDYLGYGTVTCQLLINGQINIISYDLGK
jgi:hypothetical protein